MYGVARETLVISRDLSSPDGALTPRKKRQWSVEDAYYVWKYDELASVLDEDEFEGARRVFGLSPAETLKTAIRARAPPDVPWETRHACLAAFAGASDLRARERPLAMKRYSRRGTHSRLSVVPRIRALGDDVSRRGASSGEFIKANLYRDGYCTGATWRGCRHGGTLTSTSIPSVFITCMSRHSIQVGTTCRAPAEAQNELFADEGRNH